MTNKEQIRMERLAILKDLLFAILPAIMLAMVFIGLLIATGRINDQWEEGIGSARDKVNALAVDQLKDFAAIQESRKQMEYLPEGIDAERFRSDNASFLEFVQNYGNWSGYTDMVNKYAEVAERIGFEYDYFYQSFFYKLMGNGDPGYSLAHLPTFKSGKKGFNKYNGTIYHKDMIQLASVQDIHAIEILPNGDYMYLAIVPVYRYFGTNKDYPGDHVVNADKGMCMAVWYSCDAQSVVTPVQVQWVRTK